MESVGKAGSTEGWKHYFLIILFPLFTLPSFSQLQADFVASDTSICVGDTIYFTDLSTGGPTSWSWFFGANATPSSSTEQNPDTIVYTAAGLYDVTLMLDGGSADTTFNDYIYVSNCVAPVADFSASSTTICMGDTINFTDLSIEDPTAWSWNFAGGTPGTSTDQDPQDIIYNNAGTFSVTLTASNAYGAHDTVFANYITVDSCIVPTADFTMNKDTICLDSTVNFTDLSGGNPASWSWNFGGSATPATSTAQNPSGIEYSTTGWQPVTLTVTNAYGSDSKTDSVFVKTCPPPTASFTANTTTICLGDSVYFTDLSTESPTGWAWTFGMNANPSFTTVQNPVVTYTDTGWYSVTLTASNPYGSDDTTITDYIYVAECPPPIAGFTGPDTVCMGDAVTFLDTSSGATGWNWLFEAASPATSSVQNPVNIFWDTTGTFTVFQQVTNAYGMDTISRTIYVDSCITPIADFLPDTFSVCVGDTIYFTDLSTGYPATWDWYFGTDAVPPVSTDQFPGGVVYDSPGEKYVNLEVTNQHGSHDTTIMVFIDPCYQPIASYTQTDDAICKDRCVTYYSTSSYTTSHFWMFAVAEDSLVVSSDDTVLVCYDTTGTFPVMLIASNQYGSDTIYDSTAVYVSGYPYIEAGEDTSILVGDEIRLEARGIENGIYSWYPEEYLSCLDCPVTVASPIETTTYYITVVNSTGCASIDSLEVEVREEYFAGIPTAFSPNGDGINDLLHVRGNAIKRLKFIIYNRYGQKVFHSNAQGDGWNGTHNGKPVNPGVFVYYIEAVFVNGKKQTVSGNVTLVR